MDVLWYHRACLMEPCRRRLAMSLRYRVYGLTLDSELECPELIVVPAQGPAEVRIRIAALEPDLAGATDRGERAQFAPGIYQFLIEGVARYRVERGESILVDPLPGAAAGDVRLWLLGTALGALLHQRGLLPLHVSALALGGAAYAFCGDSGAGKSTLAAALHRRGLRVLTDDVGLAVPDADHVLFHPGFPRIKLWRDALDHFGLDTAPLTRDLTRADKYHLQLVEGFQDEPLPLRHLYMLERSEDDRIHIEPLFGHRAIGLIRDHSYRLGLVWRLGRAGDHLRQCGRIAQGVCVFRFSRPWRLELLDETLEVLLGHMLGSITLIPSARKETRAVMGSPGA